ncbi:MAG: hypothetical protein K2H43_01205 [Clostridia bacterium]|nr:hypothetical protein [Clostridia bacterium]
MLNFIVNPNALKDDGNSLVAKLKRRLNEAGTEYRFFYSGRAGGVGKYAQALSVVGQRTFIAVGGDGTLNELVSNLRDPSQCTVGLIPSGTGNDFAAAANIPMGAKALDVIIDRVPVYTDYIEFGNGRRSINIAGIGIDVDILERCAKKRHGAGKTKYFHALLASLLKYKGVDLEVTVNGETTKTHAMIAAVCNGKMLGGGIPLCPEADIADGKMDLVYIDFPKRLKLMKELSCLMQGKILKRSITHHVLCDEARIVPDIPQTAQFDGELFHMDELNAKLVSGQLLMYRG